MKEGPLEAVQVFPQEDMKQEQYCNMGCWTILATAQDATLKKS